VKRASLVLCALILVAWSGSAFAGDPVRFHLKWMHGAQFAGVYAADAEGFFADAGLDVELVEGPATLDVLQDLAAGDFDFALVDPTALLRAVDQGLAIVAISAIYQIDPVVIFALAGSGIRRPQDLLGKTVMSFESSYVLHAVLARVGMGVEDIEIGPPSFDLEDLYAGAYDAWSGYIPNEVRRARADGYEIDIIFPTDYGVHLYGDVLTTRLDLIAERPDLVGRMVGAQLAGWAWVHQHLEEASALVLRWNPHAGLATEREILELSLPFIHAGDVPLGGMTDARWRDMADMMIGFDLLASGFDVSVAYTLRFVTEEDAPDGEGG